MYRTTSTLIGWSWCVVEWSWWVVGSRRLPSAAATVPAQSRVSRSVLRPGELSRVSTVVSPPSWSCHSRRSGCDTPGATPTAVDVTRTPRWRCDDLNNQHRIHYRRHFHDFTSQTIKLRHSMNNLRALNNVSPRQRRDEIRYERLL